MDFQEKSQSKRFDLPTRTRSTFEVAKLFCALCLRLRLRLRLNRNNHPGGFIRIAVVPFNRPQTMEDFEKNIVQYNCHEVVVSCTK